MGTIATHNGASVSRDHNRRKKDVVSKENHIHEEGEHYIDAYGRERIAHSETWIDMTPLQAYKMCFGEAISEFNERQIKNRHYDRCTSVGEYLKQIRQDEYKSPIYEMCVGVYGEDSTHEQKIEILREFYETWQERNPNLILVGAYLHDDEMGEVAIHLDYIPIYHCERGLGVKQGLNKALEEQGVELPQEYKGRFDRQHTRQIEWEREQNEYLESLCNARGIKIEHPMRDSEIKYEHKNTKEYIALQQTRENRELKEENKELKEENKIVIGAYEEILSDYNELVDEVNKVIKTYENQQQKLTNSYKELEKAYQKEYEENHKFDRFNGQDEWANDWDLRK